MASKRIEWSRATLTIGVFTLLAVGSWIGFDVYRSLVKTTIPSVLQTQLLPLQTSVDIETVNNLRGRLGYTQATLDQVQSVPAEAPTGIPEPLPTSLVESAPSPSQATSSGSATTSAQIQL